MQNSVVQSKLFKLKKQIPQINRIVKVIDVEELVSNPVPNYIYNEIEQEEIVEVPEERIVEIEKEHIEYIPKEIIKDEYEVYHKIVDKKVEVPVHIERHVDQRENVQIPFTLDRHVQHLVVQPYENITEFNRIDIPKDFEIDLYTEQIRNEEIKVTIPKFEERIESFETHEQVAKPFDITIFTESEKLQEVPRYIDVPVDKHADRPFAVDLFCETTKIVDKVIEVPREVLVDRPVEKKFDVILHTEEIIDKIQDIPVSVKLFEEKTIPVEILQPQFSDIQVGLPQVVPYTVEYETPVQYKENYLEKINEVDIPYNQFRVHEEAETVDINISLKKIVEVPVVVEHIREKEYPIERIHEVPHQKTIDKIVKIRKIVEVPQLNKIYKDKKVEKVVQVKREVVEEEYIEMVDEQYKPIKVDLKTTQGRVKVNPRIQKLPLKTYQQTGVLSKAQKQEFESIAKQLSELQYQQQQFQIQLQYAQEIDFALIDGDAEEHEEELRIIAREIQNLKTAMHTLTSQREILSKRISVIPEVNFEKHIDDSCMANLEKDINRIKRANSELKSFLENHSSKLLSSGNRVENKTIPSNYNQQLIYTNQIDSYQKQPATYGTYTNSAGYRATGFSSLATPMTHVHQIQRGEIVGDGNYIVSGEDRYVTRKTEYRPTIQVSTFQGELQNGERKKHSFRNIIPDLPSIQQSNVIYSGNPYT